VSILRIFSLDLKDFRGIRRIEKGPIKLAKFNVLIGKNNSGKTSVLEALALLADPREPMPLTGKTRIQAIKDYHEQQTDSLVYGYSGSATISYSTGSTTSDLVLETNGTSEFRTSNPDDVPDSRPYVLEKGTLPIRLGSPPKSLSQIKSAYYNDDFHEILRNNLMSEANWKMIEKTRAHNTVLKEVINPSINETFTDVLPHFVQRPTLQVRKEFPDRTSSYVRVSELGRGVQRVIVPLLIFEAITPSLVLWDDIEAGMHPSLIKNVLQWLVSRDWQMVISTHSIDVLSVLADIAPKEAQIIVLSKSPDDVLHYKILDMNTFDELISSQDPRLAAELFFGKGLETP